MQRQSGGTVARRKVFYLPGFDPFPPRRYRELYRREGAAQARISGYSLTMSANESGGTGYGWRVATTIDGQSTEAQVTVLVWADLVQASMQRGILGTYLLMLRTAWVFVASGALPRLIRLRPGPMLAAAWPVVMLVGQLLVALALGAGLGWGVAALVPGVAGQAFGAVLSLVAVVVALQAFRRWDARLYVYYLLYDFAHAAAERGAYPRDLEGRLEDFAAQVRAALESDCDEVLIVGHSSGAALAVSVVALVLAGGLPPGAPPLALLTLGQAIPMQSFLPRAGRLRRDLRALASDTRLTWVDISARGDGVSFNLCDPVAVSGVAPPGQIWPLVLSAAFRESLRPETWQQLRYRFFRIHFQYLAAFDRPRDYDYFQITAGSVSLADRYGGRRPSPSRKTTALSPHRGLE